MRNNNDRTERAMLYALLVTALIIAAVVVGIVIAR
jgi:predicted nucleic acid-binding Zn ribbon protein